MEGGGREEGVVDSWKGRPIFYNPMLLKTVRENRDSSGVHSPLFIINASDI